MSSLQCRLLVIAFFSCALVLSFQSRRDVRQTTLFQSTNVKYNIFALKRPQHSETLWRYRNSSYNSILSIDSVDRKVHLLKLLGPQQLIRLQVPKYETPSKMELKKLQDMYTAPNILQRHENTVVPNGKGQWRKTMESSNVRVPGSNSPIGTLKPYAKRNQIRNTNDVERELNNRRQFTSFTVENSARNMRRRNNFDVDGDDGIDASEISSDVAAVSSYPSFDKEAAGKHEPNLSIVSPVVLTAMLADGLSYEDIQSHIYAEFGVSASTHAIKRRLEENGAGRHSRKRTGKTRKDRAKRRHPDYGLDLKGPVILHVDGGIRVADLANVLNVNPLHLVKHLVANEGDMVDEETILSVDKAVRVCSAFGRDAQVHSASSPSSQLEEPVLLPLARRAPIVAIMGHVDHGKTTLLDSIRRSKVARGEVGGITQSLSAFRVPMPGDRAITFLDTPGHAAFSAMRSKGVFATDIVVLVVAADDGVMTQTKECIRAASNSGCPMVVAINKSDKEGANVAIVKNALLEEGVVLEEFGGETQCAVISAKTGDGVEDLLEKIMLQAEIMDLRANEGKCASGTVLDVRKDRGLGVVVTVLVHEGTLRSGDFVLVGSCCGRVRRILSDSGSPVDYALPSVPVQIVGLVGVPSVDDSFVVAADESQAREVAAAREYLAKQALTTKASPTAIDAVESLMRVPENAHENSLCKVPLIFKADGLGALNALMTATKELRHEHEGETAEVEVVWSGIGDVSTADIAVAKSTKATVIAFNVRPSADAAAAARSASVRIISHPVIYELLGEIETILETQIASRFPGSLIGRLRVKKLFNMGKAGGVVAGCVVLEGKIATDSQVRVSRSTLGTIFSGQVSSIKIGKINVDEVSQVGSECGLVLVDFSAFEENDIIECFSL